MITFGGLHQRSSAFQMPVMSSSESTEKQMEVPRWQVAMGQDQEWDIQLLLGFYQLERSTMPIAACKEG